MQSSSYSVYCFILVFNSWYGNAIESDRESCYYPSARTDNKGSYERCFSSSGTDTKFIRDIGGRSTELSCIAV